MSDLTPDKVLSTTRAVRKRLDFDRPVAREVLLECLELAVQAPTGSNRQGWQFLFLTDPEPKGIVADYYAKSYDRYRSLPGPTFAAGDVRGDRREKVVSSSDYLRQRMHEVPAMLIPLHEGRLPDGAATQVSAGFYGSILPAVWSFMLAARARGLGTTWTTLHLKYEREVADALGIPYERFTQVALIPIGHFTGDDFKPAARIPMETITHFDRW
ncbi:MAG: nitroreductase family protein [Candidatus Dormibacteraceae bacterium]